MVSTFLFVARIASLEAQNNRLKAWKQKQQALYSHVNDKGAERTAHIYKRDREHALHLLKCVASGFDFLSVFFYNVLSLVFKAHDNRKMGIGEPNAQDSQGRPR